MNPLFYSVTAAFLISLGSLAGIVTLYCKEAFVSKILLFLVSLSSGALMGGAFIHLLPEAAEQLPPDILFSIVLGAFIVFFMVEKIFHWRHCHKHMCETHTFGYMNLIGDGIHNFIDGIIIAGAFAVNKELGIVTTVSMALHEIPQEIGDFGVLLYAGFSKKKALGVNFAVALTVVLGSIVGIIASSKIEGFIQYLLPFAAGGFLYIAASDLVPEMRKERNLKKSIISFLIFLLGIGIMYLAKMIGHE